MPRLKTKVPYMSPELVEKKDKEYLNKLTRYTPREMFQVLPDQITSLEEIKNIFEALGKKYTGDALEDFKTLMKLLAIRFIDSQDMSAEDLIEKYNIEHIVKYWRDGTTFRNMKGWLWEEKMKRKLDKKEEK